ncbi:crocetin glucosyltransferase, chloroplastic-like [Canna indica]|uniref:Glycosyltransferase n=1 Tax=Canna indica TaxID=4628 RepID=A0AAQ3KJZ9_9LILI|nr:crocetin glucosyltransferase, chloroplastic-like [Canna indica]
MEHHFLIVSYIIQGHINPALSLGKRLASTFASAVTFSTSISAHRRMFPDLPTPDQEVHDGLVSYIPYSDGYDDGDRSDITSYKSNFQATSSKSVSAIIRSLAERGRPVTCVIHTLAWAADAARDHGIPSVLFWIQPATVFSILYHYCHGYDRVISSNIKNPGFVVNLPGLPPLTIREFPGILTISSDDPRFWISQLFLDMIRFLDQQKTVTKPTVLVNTFDELEADALASISEVKLLAVGPVVSSLSDQETACYGAALFKPKRYMEWLDSQPERSVVYVSFGSLAVLKKQQEGEIRRGLEETGRPYLWVVRKKATATAAAVEEEEEEEEVPTDDCKGMVVEWCSQVSVLSHAAVGCFVTHCGWNSTSETLACGVPAVGVPQWMDQVTNARMLEIWGAGVRAEVNGEGVLEGSELARCVEIVMGEEMRRRAKAWKEKGREALREGGSSYRNLRDFVAEIAG